MKMDRERSQAISSYVEFNRRNLLRGAFDFTILWLLVLPPGYCCRRRGSVCERLMDGNAPLMHSFSRSFVAAYNSVARGFGGDATRLALMDMDAIKGLMSVDGKEGFSALVGLPFVIVGQILSFFSGLPGLIVSQEFMQVVLVFAAIHYSVNTTSAAQTIGAVYFTLFFAQGASNLFLYDLGMLDASYGLGGLQIALQFSTVCLAVLAVRAIYQARAAQVRTSLRSALDLPAA